MQLARCFPKARSVPYLLGIVFRLMSDSSPMGSQTPSPIGKCPLLQEKQPKNTQLSKLANKITQELLKDLCKEEYPKSGAGTGSARPCLHTNGRLIWRCNRIYMEDRENVSGTYMEHRPLLTAGQEMDH